MNHDATGVYAQLLVGLIIALVLEARYFSRLVQRGTEEAGRHSRRRIGYFYAAFGLKIYFGTVFLTVVQALILCLIGLAGGYGISPGGWAMGFINLGMFLAIITAAGAPAFKVFYDLDRIYLGEEATWQKISRWVVFLGFVGLLILSAAQVFKA